MAIYDDLFTAKGLAISVGIMALAPLAAVTLAGAAKPLARATIKSGMIFYQKGRETAAEFSEVVSDLVAETRAEMHQQQETAAAQASAPTGGQDTDQDTGQDTDQEHAPPQQAAEAAEAATAAAAEAARTSGVQPPAPGDGPNPLHEPR